MTNRQNGNFRVLLPAIRRWEIDGLTQAQLDSFYAFGGFYGGVSVGAAAGQTVRVVFRTTSDIPLLKPAEEPEVIVAAGPSPGGHVKVFDASSGALLWNRELSSLTAGLHTIDINRDELPAGGNSDNGRLQVYIELVLVEYQAGRGLAGLNVYPPIFEVFGCGAARRRYEAVYGGRRFSNDRSFAADQSYLQV